MNRYVIEKIGEAAALEQLAEEAAELAQAALKLARIARGENPTPVTRKSAFDAFVEELADVKLCVSVLETEYGNIDTEGTVAVNYQRWLHRLSKMAE